MNATAAASPRLLVVDDEPDLRTLYELTLLREGYDVECAGSVEEAWGLLALRQSHLVITDMRLPDGLGLELLQRMERAGRSEKTMVITAYASPENAVEALKSGAYDYLTKPVDLRQFRAVVASALGRSPAPREGVGETGRRGEAGRSARAAGSAGAGGDGAPGNKPQAQALSRLIGDSQVMQQVRAMVEKVGRSMAPVLVQGESGTGKELVARAIHDVSPRGTGPFVAVNCGAIPENLLEAEFFGYRKGAFTGAQDDREGFFQAAQGGTLFLDEIGDLPIAMQSKLLRVIQERAVRPVGAVAEVPVNVRILSATHKDLGAEVQAARFRQDLFYRLNVIRIEVPPLRERIGDLPALCTAVLSRIARDAGVSPVPLLDAAALQDLLHYAFPGNVRELENLLHRALALASGEGITRADLGLAELSGAAADEAELAPVQWAASRAAAAPGATASGPAERGSSSPVPLPKDLVAYLDDTEREVLERALAEHRYNRTAAGASLGLSLRQMRYRMARLGVGTADGPAAPDRADLG